MFIKIKKFLMSLARTSVAMAFVAASVMVFTEALKWKYWSSSNEFGYLMVPVMYLTAFISFMVGAYGISPIFWTSISYAIGMIGLTEEEYKQNLKNGRRAIRNLQTWFLW